MSAVSASRHLLRQRLHRLYATSFPRPPPPSTEPPRVTTYKDTSRPRPYQRDLPRLERRWPGTLAFAVVGVAGWVAFYTFVTNQEKISSSVVKQTLRTVRSDMGVKEVLGEAIRPQPEWWLNGDPRIIGSINMMQGNVDVSYRIKGTKGSGTLYFTSVRRDKGLPFDILRFKIIADDGTVIIVDASTA
ncbi:DUF1783-domain-containing protein [Hymenopellis radicata]|nr:DUF1783-domain-containing protein [Hymenopellis radicata]